MTDPSKDLSKDEMARFDHWNWRLERSNWFTWL